MNSFVLLILFLFLLSLPLSQIALLSISEISYPFSLIKEGSFVEYYTITNFTSLHKVVYGYLIQYVTVVNPQSGLFTFNETIVNLNASQYLKPFSVNDSFPPSLFYFVPTPGSQNISIQDMHLASEGDGCFVYTTGKVPVNNAQGVSVQQSLWVNGSGVPDRVEILQYGYNGSLVSNLTYVLFRTNLIDPSASPFIPQSVSEGGRTFNINFSLPKLIDEVVIGVGLVAVLTILLLRGSKSFSRKL